MSTSEAVGVDRPSEAAPDETAPQAASRSARLALIAFVVYLVVGFFVLRHNGRDYWFYSDEWQLLIRRLENPADYFRPLNQHWLTLPVVAMRVLFWIFGLSYGPYQSLVIVLHLSVAAMLRWIMRRAGVSPWFSTIAASTFVLFGPGYMNMQQVIQISLVGSALFGLGHLVCADHDGGFTRRDVWGLLLGALGLMTSGLGTVMVVIVGMSVFIRRGWRMALVHTLPLVLMNTVWYVAESKWTSTGHPTEPFSYGINWVWTGERASFEALAGSALVAVALAVMLVAGLVLAWRPLAFAELRKQAAVPAALLLGGPVLFWLVSAQRWWLVGENNSSKFLHLAVAFALPALAVAANAIARRWRVVTPVVAIILLAGVPGNIGDFPHDGPFQPGFFHNQKVAVLGTAWTDIAGSAPRELQPSIVYFTAPGVTLGFLLDAKDAGRLPKPPQMTPAERDATRIRAAVTQRYVFPMPQAPLCRVFFEALSYSDLPRGTQIVINNWVSVNSGEGTVLFDPAGGLVLEVNDPELDFTINNPQNSPSSPVTVCH